MAMQVQRIAAFCDGQRGGNPAGVCIADEIPGPEAMQAIAAEVGFSETVFAVEAGDEWQVRYFSPDAEIPFCGHATIALAAAIAMNSGDLSLSLRLADQGAVHVKGYRVSDAFAGASFDSPPTHSRAVDAAALGSALELFGLKTSDLFPAITPAVVSAGSNHLLLCLRDRKTLANMAYDFEQGQALMREHGWVTVMLAHAESAVLFHVRNAFAFGGVHEDPATGAAAAALAGYLKSQGLNADAPFEIHQGDDMGVPCRLFVTPPHQPGGRAGVSGSARRIEHRASSIGQLA
jgi:PhzF family phenazine biosynthesis protein